MNQLLLEKGYRYVTYSSDKENQKKLIAQERKKGKLVRIYNGFIYSKYKPLKPEHIELIKKSLEACELELADKNKALAELELQLQKLKTAIDEIKNKKRPYENTFQELKYKLEDSGAI